MPSQNQPADTSDRLRAYQPRIDEDPARWLDWDLLADQDRSEMVRTLIDGIDSLERIRAWRAVERLLANDEHNDDARNPLDEPRGPIMQRLDQREEWLRLHGERPDRLPFGPRESCDCCPADGFTTAAELRERREGETPTYSPSSVDTSASSPTTEPTALDAFATDGGQPE